MSIEKLNEIFTADFNIDSIIALRQNRHSRQHSWMETPRRINGLFLITDYPAHYTLDDGSSFKAEVGDVLLMSKGSRYIVNFSIPEGKKTHPLMINFRLVDAENNEIILPTGVEKLTHDDHTLLPLFSAAAQHYKNSAHALLKSRVFEIIGNLFPIEPKDECMIAYINRHYTHSFNISELAKSCAMCEATYRKRFKELTGVSPVQYINTLKVQKACELLTDGDLNAADIAEFLSFCSISYFYRVFKDIKGMAPAEFKSLAIVNSKN